MARILKRPMFRRGGMPSNEGVAAVRPKYMGGGMSGIMTGINPTAGLTPRVGYQEGTTFTRGGGVMQGGSYSTRGVPVRLPATLAQVPAVIPQGPPLPPSAFSRFSKIINKIPGAGRLGLLGTYGAAAGTGYGIGQIADYITKSGDTPEAYAYRKEASEANPFLFDETSSAGEEAYINEQGELIQGDELDTFTRELTQKDQGEKYGFMPRGGKAQRLKDLGLESKFDAKTGERIKGTENKKNILNIPEPDKKQDPEKSLMDIYGENKGIIDQVMGNSDEDTKKSLYLQLAKFGAGLAAQPGGDLVGAIGKAAMPAIEGTEKTLADKKKR